MRSQFMRIPLSEWMGGQLYRAARFRYAVGNRKTTSSERRGEFMYRRRREPPDVRLAVLAIAGGARPGALLQSAHEVAPRALAGRQRPDAGADGNDVGRRGSFGLA